MYKVNAEKFTYVEHFLQKEKAKNIYILGDIARYGLDGDRVELFASEIERGGV